MQFFYPLLSNLQIIFVRKCMEEIICGICVYITILLINILNFSDDEERVDIHMHVKIPNFLNWIKLCLAFFFLRFALISVYKSTGYFGSVWYYGIDIYIWIFFVFCKFYV